MSTLWGAEKKIKMDVNFINTASGISTDLTDNYNNYIAAMMGNQSNHTLNDKSSLCSPSCLV